MVETPDGRVESVSGEETTPIANPDGGTGGKAAAPSRVRMEQLRAWKLEIDEAGQITRGLGGYTHQVRSRAPSGELTPMKSKHPLGDSTRITQGLGGYTHRVRSRAPSSEFTPTKSKHPPGDSVRITRELGGYCRGPNTGVPKEVELITIER